jgi:hypothetical protein
LRVHGQLWKEWKDMNDLNSASFGVTKALKHVCNTKQYAMRVVFLKEEDYDGAKTFTTKVSKAVWDKMFGSSEQLGMEKSTIFHLFLLGRLVPDKFAHPKAIEDDGDAKFLLNSEDWAKFAAQMHLHYLTIMEKKNLKLEEKIQRLEKQVFDAEVNATCLQNFANLTERQKEGCIKQLLLQIERISGESSFEILQYIVEKYGNATPSKPKPHKLSAEQTWEFQSIVGLTQAQLDAARWTLQRMVPELPFVWCCAKTAAGKGITEAAAIKKELGMEMTRSHVLLYDVSKVIQWALKRQVPTLRAGKYNLNLKLAEDGRMIEKRKECIATVSILDLFDDKKTRWKTKNAAQSSKNVFPIAAYIGGEDTATMRKALGDFIAKIPNITKIEVPTPSGVAEVNIKWTPVADLHTNWVWFDYGGAQNPGNCPYCNVEGPEDRLKNFGCDRFKTFSKVRRTKEKSDPILKIPMEESGI